MVHAVDILAPLSARRILKTVVKSIIVPFLPLAILTWWVLHQDFSDPRTAAAVENFILRSTLITNGLAFLIIYLVRFTKTVPENVQYWLGHVFYFLVQFTFIANAFSMVIKKVTTSSVPPRNYKLPFDPKDITGTLPIMQGGAGMPK